MSRLILLAGALLFCLEAHGQSLRVVTTPMEPFLYEVNGEPRGIEYDILRYYAKAQGRSLEVTWVASFKDVLPALERGEADVASAAITITEARKERVESLGISLYLGEKEEFGFAFPKGSPHAASMSAHIDVRDVVGG